MAKKTKNASKSGPVISRSNAIKKLQISLAAFRKLCILKGVYPVVPTNKKLSNTTTFYYRKDILYLMHDPILTVLRRQKAHVRKIKKALAKDLPEQAKRLDAEMPKYTLHHVIKDR
jgi:pescadillo protein